MHDYKYYVQVAKEEQRVEKEINERRKEILKMSNQKAKQEAWNKLFPKDLLVSDMVY